MDESDEVTDLLRRAAAGEEGALRELIEEKKKGHVPRARPVANDDTNVVDLMAALRNTLKASGKESPALDERRRPAASRRGAPAEKPRRRGRGKSAA